MTLAQRYRKLSLWNKLAVWGSLCSIAGVALYFLPRSLSPLSPPPPPDQRATIQNPINSQITLQSPQIPVTGSGNLVTVNYNNGHSLQETSEIERYTKGGAYPQIRVEPYFGPTEGISRTIATTPEKPGFIAVFVENTNDFPIFDLEIVMLDLTPQGRNPQTMESFNSEVSRKTFEMPTLHPNKIISELLPANPECRSLAFDFNTKTRAADTIHKFRFVVVSNRWEVAQSIADVKTGKTLTSAASSNYPLSAAWEQTK